MRRASPVLFWGLVGVSLVLLIVGAALAVSHDPTARSPNERTPAAAQSAATDGESNPLAPLPKDREGLAIAQDTGSASDSDHEKQIDESHIPCPKFSWPATLFAFSILCGGIAAMWGSRLYRQGAGGADPEETEARRASLPHDAKGAPLSRHLVDGKIRLPGALLRRDVGPVTFDVTTHSDFAEVAEYRGLIHWHRDVVEKILSILLALAFCFFLGRMLSYIIHFVLGREVLDFIFYDIGFAARTAGLALVVDGVVLVASMTDAPGIGRALDSIIVFLVGATNLILVPAIERAVLPHNRLGGASPTAGDSWNTLMPGVCLAAVVAVLFVVRWIIRHHTLSDWKGRTE